MRYHRQDVQAERIFRLREHDTAAIHQLPKLEVRGVLAVSCLAVGGSDDYV